MSDTPKIHNPRVHVYMADGREFEVQTANPDHVLWDRTRNKHGWPDIRQAPAMWLTFMTWNAAKRLRLIDPATTWADFEQNALDCNVLDDGPTKLDRVLVALRPMLEAAEDRRPLDTNEVIQLAEAVADIANEDDTPPEVAPVDPTNLSPGLTY